MKSTLVLSAAALLHYTAVTATPIAVDSTNNVTYQGLVRNGIEVFLGIPFGQDTGGANRFKPPQPWTPMAGSLVDATAYGAACPQPVPGSGVLKLTPVSKISEDCLNLNIARPSGVDAGAKLPVIAFIYGGGFSTGFNEEQSTAPDGMILESVQNGLPIVHVVMNYRLGVFGFATSEALLGEGSSNAGLRDQRLALEWVRDNIQHFGGDVKVGEESDVVLRPPTQNCHIRKAPLADELGRRRREEIPVHDGQPDVTNVVRNVPLG